MTKSLLDEILTLAREDLGRLKILLESPVVSRCETREEYETLLRTWINKLKNKEWIEGTPWNIPEDQQEAIIEHLDSVLVDNPDLFEFLNR